MTRRFPLLLLPVVSAACAVAVAQKPTPKPPPKPWANKMFLPDILQNAAQEPPPSVAHDFGAVPFGSLCQRTFPFTNPYDVPIQVIDIRTECGCLKAYPPNRVLRPFETAEFVVTMNAGAFKGPTTKKLLVTVGPNFLSTAELRFSCTSREDVTVTPGQIDFGLTPQGGRPSKAVTLKYTGKERNFKVTEYTAAHSAFDVEVKESARGFLSTDYTVTATLKATAPPGQLTDSITLKTSDPAIPVVSVSVGGTVRPPLTVSPEKAEFRGVKPGQTGVMKLMVKAETDCTITGLADAGDGVSVDTFPDKRQVHVVTVRYEPTAAGGVQKQVRLKTSLPGSPEVVFTVEAK
jgi:hypothetical protein